MGMGGTGDPPPRKEFIYVNRLSALLRRRAPTDNFGMHGFGTVFLK